MAVHCEHALKSYKDKYGEWWCDCYLLGDAQAVGLQCGSKRVCSLYKCNTEKQLKNARKARIEKLTKVRRNMASENETVEAAINRLKHRFDCPNDTKNPIKGEWCGACREICTADGTNWCDRNVYLDDVVAIESACRREKAELRECLKEAITRFCTHRPHEFDDGFGNCESFKNGSCVCEECWVLDSINRWRKALEGGAK